MPPENLALKPLFGYDEKLYTPQTEKRDYYPSWLEWAAQKLVQILKSTATKGLVTLYTVPMGQTLFITSAFVAQGGSNTFTASIRLQSGADLLSISSEGGADEPGHEAAIVFQMPIKVAGGGVVESNTSGSVNASAPLAGFSGFLVAFK